MSKEKPVTILLSRQEQKLITQYGYPFEKIETQLKQADKSDLARITDAPFWWERVLVNLHISETEAGSVDLAKSLRELIDRIAIELKLIDKNGANNTLNRTQ